MKLADQASGLQHRMVALSLNLGRILICGAKASTQHGTARLEVQAESPPKLCDQIMELSYMVSVRFVAHLALEFAWLWVCSACLLIQDRSAIVVKMACAHLAFVRSEVFCVLVEVACCMEDFGSRFAQHSAFRSVRIAGFVEVGRERDLHQTGATTELLSRTTECGTRLLDSSHSKTLATLL